MTTCEWPCNSRANLMPDMRIAYRMSAMKSTMKCPANGQRMPLECPMKTHAKPMESHRKPGTASGNPCQLANVYGKPHEACRTACHRKVIGMPRKACNCLPYENSYASRMEAVWKLYGNSCKSLCKPLESQLWESPIESRMQVVWKLSYGMQKLTKGKGKPQKYEEKYTYMN